MAGSWETLSEQAQAAFAAQFGGEPPSFACAPGRVELARQPHRLQRRPGHVGGHRPTTVVVGRRIQAREARVYSVNFSETDRLPLDAIDQTQPAPGRAMSVASAGP